ncbi:MAG: hypothetical protein CLLPBCKN_007828 [Chroococcidiopsis cubana SAG 39.79]|jgi:hypothetical protein|uniref:Polymerase nucleotidyl transferase domain-containing protein n=1 Tax=Chroococcidiopsis cubana SAG 39.79 TaxID=388085 RepID=A0AB37US12_9CYAN|nr:MULTISPECIES: hypothetical protein [Chroococcidiopsis]MDZ4878393.1 hypothetical protein [Chroococcidiopsis cubana SAG 39.79]PSB65861.1 hypothetical protein C7B79_03625 [Chroococcidiopsis cubana CCALA 043]RUT14248.1 hypothetical protein DSM107010_02790 [Chroococcidiopsis cubana SAG 39.79]URD50024.1 hypothetical protein M5J74_27440 [Chroococcidiopsis sp. CCNUC1]
MSSYQPQASDTHPNVDRFLMQAFRHMPVWKKAHSIDEATKGIRQMAIAGIRHQYPNATTSQIKFQLAIRWLGKDIAVRFCGDRNEDKLVDAESIQLALRMAEILDTLAIPYLIGGSVASSIWGEPRATLDVDIVADIQNSQIQPLVEMLTGEFFVDEMMVREAIERKSSFNVIHLETLQKVDIFILSNQPLAQSEMQRKQQLAIAQNPERLAWLPTPEDIILQKLIWYQIGNRVSDRQWRDVLGVLKVQSDRLDLDYLNYWAATLELQELLAQALQQSGLSDE